MVPFGLKPPQFAARLQRSLEQASPALITTLRALFAQPVQPDVARADIELFFSDDGDEPSAWIYFTGPHNKVDAADQTLFAGRSLELPLGLGLSGEFHERYFTDEKFAGLDQMARALRPWFAEAWWKAGGWTYAVPATLAVHDGWGDEPATALTERRQA